MGGSVRSSKPAFSARLPSESITVTPKRALPIRGGIPLRTPFEGLSDLRKVSGIGPATLELLRPRITLTWPEHVETKAMPGPSVVTISQAALTVKTVDPATLLDPNRATLTELQTLPGIGPKLAQRIVDQRTQRPFVDIGDLRKVPGIGPKTLDKIKPRLRIGDGATARLQ